MEILSQRRTYLYQSLVVQLCVCIEILSLSSEFFTHQHSYSSHSPLLPPFFTYNYNYRKRMTGSEIIYELFWFEQIFAQCSHREWLKMGLVFQVDDEALKLGYALS